MADAMQVANILCGNMLDRYLEIAFDSVFITLRTELKNAIVKGIKSDIERAAGALRARWELLKARASEGYPCEEAKRLGNHSKKAGDLGTLYVQRRDELEGQKKMFDEIKVVTDNGNEQCGRNTSRLSIMPKLHAIEQTSRRWRETLIPAQVAS